MFRATMCPSSGETTVFIWHLVLAILYGWLYGMQGHPYRIARTKFRINTVFLISNFCRVLNVVYFLLGNFLASDLRPRRQIGTYLTTKTEQTECFETSAYRIPMLGNYPEESIQHSEHGKSLKSRKLYLCETWYLLFCMDDPAYQTVIHTEWQVPSVT